MKVYVVTGNDFPDGVFALKEKAEKYCADQRKLTKNSEKQGFPKVYWNVHEFELVGQND